MIVRIFGASMILLRNRRDESRKLLSRLLL
jgi:hypothetical protein